MRILLTCGLGDFVAIESHLSPSERASVTAIHWATRQRAALEQLVPFVFPNLKAQHVERDTWGPPFSRTFCVSSRKELPGLAPEVVDFSVGGVVDQVRRGRRTFHGSTLVRHRLADVASLGLPPAYYVAHPYSENVRTPVRDLDALEWANVCRRLHARGVPLVVVNRGDERMPAWPGVIDLSDRLSLHEAIEVTKGAAGFVGAASVFSVVASKVVPANRLFIKGGADLKRNYSTFYYAPHVTNAIVHADLLTVDPQ